MENENKSSALKIVTGILAVLLIVAAGFAIKLYNQEKDTKAELTKEKEIVLKDLKQMVGKYDAVIEENNLKDTELNEARDRINILIDSVQGMEEDISVLRRFRNEVYRLQKEREILFAQNDSLRGINKMLAMRVDSTTYELELEQLRRDSLSILKDRLEDKVKLGASLSATRLMATGVIVRNSGKLKENDNPRRVDKIRACFTVPENRLADAGDKILYVQVLDPQSNIIGENKTLVIDSITSITYSAASEFYYENSSLDICENVSPRAGGFSKGTYTVNVYDGKEVIARTTMILD
ncbi:MAG: hypothetical protein WBG71_00560 [Leeuwenhoekiella sp.]